MSVVVGSGDFTYRVDPEWGVLPDGWDLRDVAAVAVDHKDNVYVFNRGQHPMIVFDRDGNFLSCAPGARISSAARMGFISVPTKPCTAPMTAITRCAPALSTARC